MSAATATTAKWEYSPSATTAEHSAAGGDTEQSQENESPVFGILSR